MNIDHLTIYFDAEKHNSTGMGHCVDIELPDNSDGTRASGTTGYRFETAAEVAAFVVDWLSNQAIKS
jgi:hypothetical protein